jgi:CubicO group peptidase (beta-lactamase class C family)
MLTRTLAPVAIALVAESAAGAAASAPQRVGLNAAGAREAVMQIARRHPFSGSILVAKNGKVVVEMAIGDRDRANRRPARLGTRYRISDLTGLFTWIGLLQLSDRGVLNLESSVCAVFRPCPRAWRRLRPRDLAAGMSGLRPVRRAELPAWPPTLAQYVDVLRSKPLFFRPGSRFAPNTSPYFAGPSATFLAARLLEVASQRSWFGYVHAHVLEPAGMTSTNFAASSSDAIGYGRSRSRAPVPLSLPRPTIVPPLDGGMWSTVADFARLDRALRPGRLLSTRSLAILDSPASARDRVRGQGPSCCWIVGHFLGHPSDVDGAHGAGDGFYTVIERFPQDGVVTLVFTNFGGSGVFAAADLLSTFALGEYPVPVAVAPAKLAGLAGTYGRGDLVVRVVKGRLTVVRGFDPLPGPLIATSETTFVPTYAPAVELAFAVDPNGRGTAVAIHWGGSRTTTLYRQRGS